MKKCSKCQMLKQIGEFGANRARWDGYANNCRICVSKYNKNTQMALTADQRKKASKITSDWFANLRRTDPRRLWAMRSLAGARKNGVNVLLSLDEIVAFCPDHCPVLGIELLYENHESQPQTPCLTRMKSAQPMASGNVLICSRRALIHDSTITLDEIKQLKNWMKSITLNPSTISDG